ncbi:retropepsin-like aspartic protease family protein [Sphingomonas colocasiae]|uniref:TIGR02281 family clan AA aspartic protease n=1 Tax=Sphingomonas colocasiae TaxID=1848973 RepID=A0ABS7PJD4_9SPHN|nr:TIGR02281 family clan AA aspartic protease [Sphingomonas colocasiae]MBY8821397.1 TIGR02281 family clan AA aspartic protease [Sphingomonas colocasiae]
MNEDQSISLIYAVGGLVLVGSALAARRLPMRQTLKMALAWVAIFAGLFVIVALRDDFGAIWQKVKTAAVGESAETVGGSLRIPASEDGHYYAVAIVNGHSVRFMIDTGATVTSMSRDTAKAVGIALDGAGYPAIVETANGLAEAQRSSIDRFQLGPIEREGMHVFVMEELGDTNLLGMNFLSSLKSWRVEGRTLILEG